MNFFFSSFPIMHLMVNSALSLALPCLLTLPSSKLHASSFFFFIKRLESQARPRITLMTSSECFTQSEK